MVKMLSKKQVREIDKIERAIDAFALEIKRRMFEKYQEGLRGWDKMSELDRHRMAKMMKRDAVFAALGRSNKKSLVDIGARAMILWHRNKRS